MGKEALKKAENPVPSPTPPPINQDTSVVARAAREAGERMEAEKAAKTPNPNNPKKYACGGVVRSKYGNY